MQVKYPWNSAAEGEAMYYSIEPIFFLISWTMNNLSNKAAYTAKPVAGRSSNAKFSARISKM